MKLQLKVGLGILPLVLLSIMVLGFWAIEVTKDRIEKSTFRHMNTILNAYATDTVSELYNILVKNRLDKEEAFVKDYQLQAARAAEKLDLTETGHIFVLDTTGKLVFCSKRRESRTMELLWGKQAIQIAQSSVPYLAGHLHNSHDGYVYVARYFQPWKWVIFYAVSDEEIHTAQNSIRNMTLWIAGICAIGSIILISLVFRVFFVKPVTILHEAASAIARGKTAGKIPVDSRDELGDLTRNMECMSQAIQKHREEQRHWQEYLEAQVEVRTRKLKESEKHLRQAKEAAEEAQRAAEAANRAKSTFLANMSHELRTPLNAILGFTQIMTRNQSLSQEDQENLGIIIRNGEHLLTLINQVLDLSKIEAGRMTLCETDFDVYSFLDDLENMFSLKARNKHLHLLFERTEDVPQYVRTDKVKLREVLINLLNNAIKFTEKGTVSLRVYELNELEKSSTQKLKNSKTQKLCFEVEDTGPGIAPEEMDKLFEAFGQTETGRDAQEGTGLGLSISRKFVQLMGGDITVKSKVGDGAIFTFDIQVGAAEASDLEQTQPTRRAIALEPGQPRYRLLIVDDKPDNRKILVKLLNPFGFKLREASNGQEAIEIWETWEPHLIWMDLRMPELDGYKATRHIKSTPKGKQTMVIVLSASIVDEERIAVIAAGCDDFLRKPFRDAQIFDLLHKHLDVRFMYEESRESKVESRKSTGEEVLTSEALAALPEELQTELQQAIEVIDMERANSLIERVRQQNEPLANALAELVKNYRFDILQELFEKIS